MHRKNFYYLPKKYHDTHRYCEYIVSQIEAFITQRSFEQLRTQKVKLTPEQSAALQNFDGDVLDFFEKYNLTDELNMVVSRRLLHALIMDTCYFLQEGFNCCLRMRMSVAFTLFRKPFSEILIIYLRLLLDGQFLKRFSDEGNFNPVSLSKDKKLEYLNAVNSALGNMYVVNDLYEYLFDKSSGDNLYNISNHAIHLYTDKNPVLQTEKQNLNFIFSGKDEIQDQWEYIYRILPMLLSFLSDVIEFTVIANTDIPDYVFRNRFRQRNHMRTRFKVN